MSAAMTDEELAAIREQVEMLLYDGDHDRPLPGYGIAYALLAEVDRLRAQVAAVRDLHSWFVHKDDPRQEKCCRIGGEPWPCMTIRALGGVA